MNTLIAKLDHRTPQGHPILRLPNGSLFAGNNEIVQLNPNVGDIVIFSGEWQIASADAWEPIREVGTVEFINGSDAVIRTTLGLYYRTIPNDLSVAIGSTVIFNTGSEIMEVFEVSSLPGSPHSDDFEVDKTQIELSDSLGWDDFLGFPDLINEAKNIVDVHTQVSSRQKILELGITPVKGILFEGPPGTGKTHLAQIMAAKSKASFYLVTTASLGGRLVSESEQRLEAIYRDAASKVMSIVFIDEIDVLTQERGTDQGQNSRLVNVFLTNMDGVNSASNVITIGTTNRIADIDRALRRPGRFDREISFRHPNRLDRATILRGRAYRTSGDLDYEYVADATSGWTAAELGAIWQHAGDLTVISNRDSIYNDYFLMGFERAQSARQKRLNGNK